MSWNYRILRHRSDDEEWLQMHEVYYDKNGKAWACSKNESAPSGSDLDELKEDMEYYLQALGRPIIDYDGIPEEGAENPAPSVYKVNRFEERP